MSILLFAIINTFNLLLLFFVYPKLGDIMKWVGIVIYVLQVTSQVLTTIINPGIPHRNNYVSDGVMETIHQHMKENNMKFDKYRVCKGCNILVNIDQNVTHCEDCDICVEGRYKYNIL